MCLVCDTLKNRGKNPYVDSDTLPCVDSKRPRVHRHHVRMFFNMCAWCRYGVVWCGVVRCGVVMSSFRIVFLSFCRPVVNLAVTPPSRVAVVLLVSCSRLVVAVSSCGGPCLKSVPVSYDKYTRPLLNIPSSTE